MDIREATVEDAPTLHAIAQVSLGHASNLETIATQIRGGAPYYYFVATIDDIVCGYLSVQALWDEGDILDVAVAPAMRRRGVGRRLVEETLQRLRMRGVRRMFLEVRTSNHPAMQLYEQVGWQRIAVRKRYYEDPVEDALIMQYDWEVCDERTHIGD